MKGGLKVRFFRFLSLILLLLLSMPAGIEAAERLSVAAASDMTFALREIAEGFKKETGVDVTVAFGSTGMLARQITRGAPFDVFLAADLGTVEDMGRSGYIIPGTVTTYAWGRLVLTSSRASSLDLVTLKDLLKSEVKSVAIANPAHAPYGRAAVEALMSAGIYEKVKGKLVYGENVRQALQFVQTGNAEAGIIALSIANVPEITYTEIPQSLYGPIVQAAGVVGSARNEKAARDFIGYLKSIEARLKLKKYGFLTPDIYP